MNGGAALLSNPRMSATIGTTGSREVRDRLDILFGRQMAVTPLCKFKRVIVVAMVALCGVAGCTTLPKTVGSLDNQTALLDGRALFGDTVRLSEVEDVDILDTSESMADFVDRYTGDTRIPVVKFRRLFNALIEEGYFRASYLANTTGTARQTFETRGGNCLSYTNLFIALARQAGLDARYQIVEVPPSWDADSGYLIRYTHINALMKGFTFDTTYGANFSVDFNDVLPDPEYPRHEVSDAEATALFYANRSISLLRAGEIRPAFAHLKRAILLSPENSDFWINLGALYSKQEHYQEAIQAYEIALHHEPSSRGAMSGLSRAHHVLGNQELAELYEAAVSAYREKNPYFHFAVAQAEYENAHYDKALDAINAAIDLKYRSGRFHFLKGLTEHKLGETEAAQQSFKRAARFGNYRDLKQRYVSGVANASPLG